MAESFESSVPWDKCLTLRDNVIDRIGTECKLRKIVHFAIGFRISQVYESGCCVYFYFLFRPINSDDTLKNLKEIYNAARSEILDSGGSISHHHGIGKHQISWYEQCVSPVGVQIYKNAKKELDPKNIFAIGNLMPAESTKNGNDNLVAKL